jgi:hypothetical protein
MCNIQIKHMKHTLETHIPARSLMPTVTRHESSKRRIQMQASAPIKNSSHSLSGHYALSGHAVHAWAPRTACIPCRASDRTRSQALTRKKDRCGPCLTTTMHASFFLGYHAMRVRSVRTDVHNQALLFFLRRCPCPRKWNLYRWFK